MFWVRLDDDVDEEGNKSIGAFLPRSDMSHET